jgi:hypothetical protein
MSNIPNYPESVAEVLDPSMKFRPDVLRAVRAFKKHKPWRGSLDERKLKFSQLHQDLCRIYRRTTTLTFGKLDGGDSGGSSYSRAIDAITLTGRLSVVTYLHEWGHALGKDEREACRWSINLFRRIFPRLFERCRLDGHMLRRPDAQGPAQPNDGAPKGYPFGYGSQGIYRCSRWRRPGATIDPFHQ